MGLVTTVHEVAIELINLSATAASAQFGPSVQPIYGANGRGDIEHLGSCTFIEVSGVTYVVTAAHLIDAAKHTAMYVGLGGGPLVKLRGDFGQTLAPGGRRSEDHYDFAWQTTNTWSASAQARVRAIAFKDIVKGGRDLEYSVCVAIGYPNSKNKRHNHLKRSVSPTPHAYSAQSVDMPKACQRLGISGADHIFLARHKRLAKNASGQIVNAVEATGMSGGAVVDMSSVARPEAVVPGYKPKGHLAGMIIERIREGALVVVKTGVIVSAINKG